MKIAVIGSTIAGLAAGLTLRQRGHRVTVVESQTEAPINDRGYIPCPPNMVRLLKKWGFESSLQKIAYPCNRLDFRGGLSGNILASLDWEDDLLLELGAEFLLLERIALRGLLRQAAEEKGVVLTSATLDHLDSESSPMFLHLQNEQILRDIWLLADLVVITDTLPKNILETDFEPRLDPAREYGHYLFQIPNEAMKNDTDLKQLLNPNSWLIWFGRNGCELVGTVASPEGVFEGRLTCRMDTDLDDTDDNIDSLEYLDESECKAMFDKMSDYAQATDFVTTMGYYTDSVVSNQGKVVLVGDAAKPPVPGNIYAAALGIEEAELLAYLLPQQTDPSKVSKLLITYEEIQETKCAAVRKCGYSHLHLHDLSEHQVQWTFDCENEVNGQLSGIWEDHKDVHGFDVEASVAAYKLEGKGLGLEKHDDLIVVVLKEVTTTSHAVSPF